MSSNRRTSFNGLGQLTKICRATTKLYTFFCFNDLLVYADGTEANQSLFWTSCSISGPKSVSGSYRFAFFPFTRVVNFDASKTLQTPSSNPDWRVSLRIASISRSRFTDVHLCLSISIVERKWACSSFGIQDMQDDAKFQHRFTVASHSLVVQHIPFLDHQRAKVFLLFFSSFLFSSFLVYTFFSLFSSRFFFFSI